MTRRPRAPEGRRGRPAAGTHRTAATTAANRVRDSCVNFVACAQMRFDRLVQFLETARREVKGHGSLYKSTCRHSQSCSGAHWQTWRGRWLKAESSFLVPPWLWFVSCFNHVASHLSIFGCVYMSLLFYYYISDYTVYIGCTVQGQCQNSLLRLSVLFLIFHIFSCHMNPLSQAADVNFRVLLLFEGVHEPV